MAKTRLIEQVVANAKIPEERLLFSAGVALQYVFAPPGVRYSAPYAQIGKELWTAAEYELYSILCDKNTRSPKGWASEIASGDVRDLVVAVLTALVASLSVPLSVAVPIASLAVKRELGTFCELKLRKPKRTLAQLIDGQRKSINKDRRSLKSTARVRRKKR